MQGRLRWGVLLAVAAAGCDRGSQDAAKRDTSVVVPSVAAAESARTGGGGGVPAVPAESATTAAADSGVLRITPAAPRRGDAVVVLAVGLSMDSPHCTWKGATLPCYTSPQGVRAVIGLPADEPAGTFTLTIDRPSGRIVRQIAVGERDFGRELLFLTPRLHALVTQGEAIARDARAIDQALSAESPEQRWSGSWRQPVQGGKSTPYGVQRFYLRASDSTHAVSLDSSMRTRGSFGTDTSIAGRGDIPGWRHAGVDIPARRGSTVRAPAAAVVAQVADYVLTGRTVVLDHGQGVHSAYFHLDSALVKPGERVRAGQAIGRVGESGLATGPHLHFGVYIHGKDVDPEQWRKVAEEAADTSGSARSGAGQSDNM